MVNYWKKYNISIFLITLVLSLSGLSWYNYYVQKNLLLEQMKNDAEDIVSSISAAMNRFHDIKSTMSIQKLVNDVSLGLEIFEFRYIEADGTIRNSMFKEEIGQKCSSIGYIKSFDENATLGKFFFEVRDYVPVMAIYYPIEINHQRLGIIDLAVDVSEYKNVMGNKTPETSLLRRQTDILNLLKSIEGSIHNSTVVYSKTDLNDFLSRYVETAKNIVQISLVDESGKIMVSSNKALIGKELENGDFPPPFLTEVSDRPIYRLVMPNMAFVGGESEQLLLLIDAAPYVKNEKRLLMTAVMTSAVAILFALFISRAIYYSAINRSREEKEQLERLVKERTKEIELLSKTDALTGLWNRGYLEEMLELEFKRSRRYGHTLAIVVIDLDHFKKINDTYGHMGGDEVLREVSRRLKGCMRETDFIGRYGGEEIVVILAETSAENAVETADKIRTKVEEAPVSFNDLAIPVTASLGLSLMRDEHANYEEIFSEADEALYVSKKEGRNRVSLYKHAVS